MERTLSVGKTLACALRTGLLFSILLSGQIAAADEMTIEQAVQYALGNSPAIGMAREGIEKSKAEVRQATAQGMPQLNVQGTYTRLDEVSEVSFGDGTVALNSLDNQVANLTLNQPIDVFGIIKTGRHAAKMSKSGSEHEYDQTTNDTILGVKEAYYTVLRTQRVRDVQQKRVEQLQAHLEETQAHLKAETAAPFDVLRAETEVTNATQTLITVQNRVELAKAAFNNMLGRDLSTPVELEEPGQPDIVELQLDACLSTACSARPEILRMQTQQGLADDMLTIARKGNMPQIGLAWTMNQNLTTTMFSPRENSWTGFVTVSMPIFDGGKNKATVDRAKSDLNSTRLGYEQTLLGVKLDTQQAYLSLNDSRARINAAGKGLDQARESMRLAQVRYKAGVSTQVEVFDAQTALTQAEVSHVDAVYDYYTAMAHLEKAVGGRTQLAKLIESSKALASRQ